MDIFVRCGWNKTQPNWLEREKKFVVSPLFNRCPELYLLLGAIAHSEMNFHEIKTKLMIKYLFISMFFRWIIWISIWNGSIFDISKVSFESHARLSELFRLYSPRSHKKLSSKLEQFYIPSKNWSASFSEKPCLHAATHYKL